MRLKITALALVALGAAVAYAADGEAGGLEIVKVRPNFYLIAGAGGNIGVQIGSDGVVLVDAGSASAAPQAMAALKSITNLPVRYIIDTNAEPDHVGGNGAMAKAGYTIFTNALGNAGMANAMTNGGVASILAQDRILQKMSAPTGKSAAYPVDSWPTEAYYQKRKAIRMSGEGIEILAQPAAHSDADNFVVFRGSDVVMAGDVLDTTQFPIIDLANGGSIQGEIDALNKLIELAIAPIPFIYEGVGTYVVPGHGRICEQMDVVDYRDMVVIVRDAVWDLIKQGKNLEQIQAAHPAKPFETGYGTAPGSTSRFIESIYKSLTSNAGQK